MYFKSGDIYRPKPDYRQVRRGISTVLMHSDNIYTELDRLSEWIVGGVWVQFGGGDMQ